MTGLVSSTLNFFKRLGSAFLILEGLVLLLSVAILVILAPFPQLAIHIRWCLQQGAPLGWLLLSLGVLGLSGIMFGLRRKKKAFHRLGAGLIALPVIGVALHLFKVTGDWSGLSFLAAFLFSTLLIYGTFATYEQDV